MRFLLGMLLSLALAVPGFAQLTEVPGDSDDDGLLTELPGTSPPSDFLTGIGGTPTSRAVAFYDFSSPTYLGWEGGDDTVPYAADFESGSSQYANGGDILDTGAGISWGVVAWGRWESAINAAMVSKAVNGTTTGDFNFWVTAGGTLTLQLHDGTSYKNDQKAGAGVVGARTFFHGRYDATANELEVGSDNVWTGSPTSMAGDGGDNSANFLVGAGVAATVPWDGTLGTVAFYRASGGQVLTDAITTSLYNSGKGRPCDRLVEAELVNLVSCWDMDEDGGPYVDEIGSNDLTGVNTPTQAEGLVRIGSGDTTLDLTPVSTPTATGGATGYAADFENTTDQHANGGDIFDTGSGISFGFACWGRRESAGTQAFIGKGDDLADEGEFDAFEDGSFLYVRFHDGTDLKSDTIAVPAVGARNFYHGRHNATAQELEVGLNGVWSGSPTTTTGDGTNIAHDFYLATNIGETGATYDGVLGSCVFYQSASGGEVPSDAQTTSLYNQGRGKTCAELTAAEQTNLVSCWDMDEAISGSLVAYTDAVQEKTAMTKAADSITASWPFGTAVSTDFYDGDVTLTATARADDLYAMFCLDDGGVWNGGDIISVTSVGDYCIYTNNNSYWYAWELGSSPSGAIATYDPGDTFTIKRVGSTVTYYKNDVLGYTSLVESTDPLLLALSARDVGAGFYDVSPVGGAWRVDTNSEVGFGMNPLTPKNTPTQAAALVEQPESGMSTWMVATSTQYFASSAAGLKISGPFSICGWGYRVASGVNTSVGGNYKDFNGFYLRAGTANDIRLYVGNGTSVDHSAAPGTVPTNEWFHACGTHDGVTATAYLNTNPDTTPTSVGSMTAGTIDFEVGSVDTGVYWDGAIDQVTIFDYDIGQTGVNDLYKAGEGEFY